MKGPSLRLKFHIHRRWECPVCHTKVQSSGAVTSMTCPCEEADGKTHRMQLVADGEPMLPWREPVAVASVATSAAEGIDSENENAAVDTPAPQRDESGLDSAEGD